MTRDLPDTSHRAIGERLANVRQARGWSQGYIASLIGSSPARYSNWERGLNAPPPDFLGKLWQVTGATPDYVLFGRMESLPHELFQALQTVEAGRKTGTDNQAN